jgi:uncharacterized membrane protein (GlpM family)
MTPALTQILAAGGHPIVNETPFPPIIFGVISMVAFLVLLGALWSFRNTLALDPHGVADDLHDPDSGRGSTS